MKKLLISILVLGTISCTKEVGEKEEKNIIAVRCSDGAILNSKSQSACGMEYTITELVQIQVAGQWISYTQTIKKTHGYFIEFIYGKGTYCENFPILCKDYGKNY